MQTSLPFKKIIIIGGGTAGWMSACYLAKMWQDYDLEIKIIESDAIGTIGVGEGTTPSIKGFFEQLGIEAKEWMPACNATYKTGIRFVNWSSDPNYKSYFHPFYSQLDEYFQHEFFQNIQLKHRGFDVHAHPDQYLLASELAQQRKAPIEPEHYPFDMAYAYHFDATLLAQFLKKKALQWNVTHQVATINEVKQKDDGSVASVVTESGETIEADFFVDCSGFRSLLLGKTLKVPYNSFADSLLNDSAVTIVTEREDTTPSMTLSTALSCGWAWRIPLTNRFGNGYVFSSRFQSPQDAEEEFRRHLALPESAQFNHLKMRVGHFAKGWEKNVLAVGLSQGFIEPLEATALHFATQSVVDFVSAVDNSTDQAGYSNQTAYNNKLSDRFSCVRDYIELHYLANSRHDTPYWKAARSHTPSRRLQRILTTWHQGKSVPRVLDEEAVSLQLFGHESWLCLLAGKGVFPESEHTIDALSTAMRIDMQKIKHFVETSAKHYPLHDDALAALKQS